MEISQVLPVVPVRNMEIAIEWYEKLLGRPADSRPMESLANWTITDNSTLQVFHDPTNAGHVSVNFSVTSMEDAQEELQARGIVLGDLFEASQFARILPVTDPDGNTITLLEKR